MYKYSYTINISFDIILDMKTTQTEKKNVVFSFLGIEKDQKESTFRPNIELCEQDNLHIDELYLFHQPNHSAFGEKIKAEIEDLSKGIRVELIELERDAFTLDSVFPKLKEYFSNFTFNHNEKTYYLHLATGTHIELICFFLLAEWNSFTLLQTIPKSKTSSTRINKINLHEERYIILNEREIKTKTDQQRINALKQGINTKNRTFNDLIEEINYVVQHDDHPILLTGPTGAGKTNLAKLIYEILFDDKKKYDKFHSLNCATLCGGLVESELFGHVKGAFTGADIDHIGIFEKANGGLLFLDEIGELPLDTQAKLLKVIEDNRFRPVGSTEEKESHFRLICGTNKNLDEEVKHNRFRRDLLERINTWPYRLPGLAERREDIEPNLEFEIRKLNEKEKKKEEEKEKILFTVQFTEEAKNLFLEYSETSPWEGNFRELKKLITRMAVFSKKNGGKITQAIVKNEITRIKNSSQCLVSVESPSSSINLNDFLEEGYETKYNALKLHILRYIIQVCKESKTQTEAGKKLFNNTKNPSDRISKELQKFGLTWEKIKHPKNHPTA